VVNRQLLGIYLNDHLAGATGGIELARRSLRNNRDGPLAKDLQRILREVEEDRATLEGIIDRLGLRKSQLKPGAAWVAEKMFRLKLNGRLLSYSPLSRVLELETLGAGVEAKRALWASLKRLVEQEGTDLGVDLDELIARAQRQRRLLERRRLEAAAEALAGSA